MDYLGKNISLLQNNFKIRINLCNPSKIEIKDCPASSVKIESNLSLKYPHSLPTNLNLNQEELNSTAGPKVVLEPINPIKISRLKTQPDFAKLSS